MNTDEAKSIVIASLNDDKIKLTELSKLSDEYAKATINLENENDLSNFIEEIQNVQKDRYSGLNLLNINNGKNTIEFRVPNGTINPDTWIENARLFGRIVEISQKLVEIEKKPEEERPLSNTIFAEKVDMKKHSKKIFLDIAKKTNQTDLQIVTEETLSNINNKDNTIIYGSKDVKEK